MMARRLRRCLFSLVVTAVSLMVMYGLAAWILGMISTRPSSQFHHDTGTCHDVYVVSNGVHLNILLPMQSDAMNWKQILPTTLAHSQEPFVQIGWGSRSFYTQVPTWADLTPKVAMQALFFDESVLYVQPANLPASNDKRVRHLRMCKQELTAFSQDIAKQFASTQPITSFNDYYPAHGHYTPLLTCNEWVRQRLKHRSMPLWSPFDQPILNHLPI